MTKHLSDAELVDYVEGVLVPSRTAHAEECGACGERATSLRQILLSVADTSGVDVPEPSPLFWDHFSRRVHDAVREAPLAGRHSPWLRTPWLGWVSAAALVLVLAVATIVWRQQQGITSPRATDTAPNASAANAADAHLDLDNDEEWALVRVVADDLHWDDAPAAGINAQPGSAELVALEMSPTERQELARLIENEMKRTGA